ncbi:MAG: glycosyltransferase [Verrucomicrobia bacterium]|nr:glycosyltransferase [Verrucomicrobiota bacterium]
MPTPIRVKFLGNYATRAWERQLPSNQPTWGACEFLFDPTEQRYDWLVIYNDFPGEHLEESLRCHPKQTLLITTEPHTIKSYGPAFTKQFGHVLTSQPDWALPHPGQIYSQCALQWFYGVGRNELKSYDEMVAHPPLTKTKMLSTVCSAKQQTHTLHKRRYDFTQAIKKNIPSMEIYGHGVKPMDDKSESMDDYRYHIAIENFIGKHHWTEKLADVFIGVTLSFYSGCPNAAEYFPEESFIPIDVNDVSGSTEIILKTMRDNEFEKRLKYILEARRRVLEEENMFAVLSKEIESLPNDKGSRTDRPVIMGRRRLRVSKPSIFVTDGIEKARVRLRHWLGSTAPSE